jgi:hypothetical protein
MRTGSPSTFALSRSEVAVKPQPHVLGLRNDPRSRIVRTFVFTFATWALFLCFLLVFAV